eukprot:CAMPEP_0119473662 /NCGR_PEP_ID=MMETSP1344-20130328/5232_1 /TAXON_ID=236787 /ORGANISM="Florenciella parvula, Strain CCMP2471" /LENGTH=139 /DNA_ID=CAMNT_0007506823 /DNA_START=181 /DNA_END=597 /DNA_ORIENTATION=-
MDTTCTVRETDQYLAAAPSDPHNTHGRDNVLDGPSAHPLHPQHQRQYQQQQHHHQHHQHQHQHQHQHHQHNQQQYQQREKLQQHPQQYEYAHPNQHHLELQRQNLQHLPLTINALKEGVKLFSIVSDARSSDEDNAEGA